MKKKKKKKKKTRERATTMISATEKRGGIGRPCCPWPRRGARAVF